MGGTFKEHTRTLVRGSYACIQVSPSSRKDFGGHGLWVMGLGCWGSGFGFRILGSGF